jgi:O-antigen/teichoic acid export membrane protein
MSALITRHRLLQLTSFASTQLVVQVIGFAVGIVLIRSMDQVDYGYYTLALSMVGMAVC